MRRHLVGTPVLAAFGAVGAAALLGFFLVGNAMSFTDRLGAASSLVTITGVLLAIVIWAWTMHHGERLERKLSREDVEGDPLESDPVPPAPSVTPTVRPRQRLQVLRSSVSSPRRSHSACSAT